MKNEEEISIPKRIIIDLITELRIIDVALYRFSQDATIGSTARSKGIKKNFAALFAENKMGERISSTRTSFINCLISDGKITESDLDEIDINCASKLLEDLNIKY